MFLLVILVQFVLNFYFTVYPYKYFHFDTCRVGGPMRLGRFHELLRQGRKLICCSIELAASMRTTSRLSAPIDTRLGLELCRMRAARFRRKRTLRLWETRVAPQMWSNF